MVFDIKRYAINDGPGIRTAVFMKGCPLACWWCHNLEGQLLRPQLMYRANRCLASQACLNACPQEAILWNEGPLTNWEACDDCGLCADVCYAGAREMVGHPIVLEQLMAEIERDIPFYDQSGGGVTFTGGEPLLQIEFLSQALCACNNQGIHTVVDTSGYAPWSVFQFLLPLVDLFLYDIKLMDPTMHIKYTTVSNRKILDNLRKLSSAAKRIIVRIPIIPGVTDDEINLHHCGEYLTSLEHLEGVELMPYHEIGVAKYQALGMNYKMENASSPSDVQINAIEALFAGYNLPVIKHPSERSL